MTLVYATSLDLKIRPINVKAQKIDGSTLQIFDMVLTSFQIDNKLNQSQFF